MQPNKRYNQFGELVGDQDAEPNDENEQGDDPEDGEDSDESSSGGEDSDEGSSDSAIEDDQTSQVRMLRDQLEEERHRVLEQQRSLEAKRAAHRQNTARFAKRVVQVYGHALHFNPGPAAAVLAADGGAGVEVFGGGGIEGDQDQVGGDQDQIDRVQGDLEGLNEGLDLTQLARAMVRVRRSPFYAQELERYRQRYQGVSELIVHLFAFVSTMEHHGLAPPNMPPRPGSA